MISSWSMVIFHSFLVSLSQGFCEKISPRTEKGIQSTMGSQWQYHQQLVGWFADSLQILLSVKGLGDQMVMVYTVLGWVEISLCLSLSLYLYICICTCTCTCICICICICTCICICIYKHIELDIIRTCFFFLQMWFIDELKWLVNESQNIVTRT